MVLQNHVGIFLQFFQFPRGQNLLVYTFWILHHLGKILLAKWIQKIGFRSYGYALKLSFGTFNSVTLIFGGMGIRKNYTSVQSIRENDRESLQIFNCVISPVVCTYVVYGGSFKINLKQNNLLEIRLIDYFIDY